MTGSSGQGRGKSRKGEKLRGKKYKAAAVTALVEATAPSDELVVSLLEATLETLKEERAALAGQAKTPYYWGLVGAVNAVGAVLRTARLRAAGPHGVGSGDS